MSSLPPTHPSQSTLGSCCEEQQNPSSEEGEGEDSYSEAENDGWQESGPLSPDTGDEVDAFSPLSDRSKDEILDEILAEFKERPVYELDRPDFKGCGVYAIFYHGDLDLYDEVSNPPRQQNRPIYVGKAPPKGSRKGTMDVDYDVHKLAQRIGEHHDSIQEAQNLRVSDFTYTYLVLEEPWIRFAEKLLTDTYRPWWNCYMDGFGNHDVGSGRSGSKQSIWDTFHPGRSQVKKRALVPRGDQRDVWREEVVPKIREDGVYELVEFLSLDVSPYDPREGESGRRKQSAGIHQFYD